MMVGSNLKDAQLQQIVDKTILFHDKVFFIIKKKIKIYVYNVILLLRIMMAELILKNFVLLLVILIFTLKWLLKCRIRCVFFNVKYFMYVLQICEKK